MKREDRPPGNSPPQKGGHTATAQPLLDGYNWDNLQQVETSHCNKAPPPKPDEPAPRI